MLYLIRPHKFENGDFCSFGVTEAAGAITLAQAAAGASIASAGLGAFGAIKQGESSAASAKYNSEVQQTNAQIAKQNADFVGQEANANLAASQQKTRAEAGAIRANQAASGIDVGSGSAEDVQESAKETGQLNAINIRADAVRKAYGYQTQETSDEAQSELDQSEAKNDETSGIIGGATTALGGAGNAVMGYENYLTKKSGL